MLILKLTTQDWFRRTRICYVVQHTRVWHLLNTGSKGYLFQTCHLYNFNIRSHIVISSRKRNFSPFVQSGKCVQYTYYLYEYDTSSVYNDYKYIYIIYCIYFIPLTAHEASPRRPPPRTMTEPIRSVVRRWLMKRSHTRIYIQFVYNNT